MTYHCKDPEKPRVLLLGPTGISAVNIGRTTIHSGFGINPGPNVLIDKSKAALNYKLFIDLLNKVRVGNIDDDVENLLKAKLIMNLMKTIPKIPCTCMEKMNQL